MSFEIKLQSNQSEPHKLSKSISTVRTITGVLKDECSIVDPVILVKAGVDSIVGINYLTLPSLNRSYFVTDFVSKTSNLTEIYCHIDVLSTYRSQIRAHTAILARAETKGNYELTLNDGSINALQTPQYDFINFDASETMYENYLIILSGASERESNI